MTSTERAKTLGELRDSGYRVVSVREEMRRNLIHKITANEELFPGHRRVRGHRHPGGRERHSGGSGRHPAGRAGAGQVQAHPRAGGAAGRRDPQRGRLRDQRRSVRSHLQGVQRPPVRDGRRPAHSMAGPRPALRGEAGHSGHRRRRPHRRGGPHQGGGGPATSPTSSPSTTASSRAPIAASSPSTSCRTWQSAYRSAYST